MQKISFGGWKSWAVGAASVAGSAVFVTTIFKILADRPGTVFGGIGLVYFNETLPVAAKILFWGMFVLLVCIATLATLKFLSKKERFHVPVYLTALFLTFTLIIGTYCDSESPKLFYTAGPIYRIISLAVLAFAMYMALTELYKRFDRVRFRSSKAQVINDRRAMLWAFLVLVLLWIPFILATLPGSICYDAAHQLADFMRGTQIGVDNPILVTTLFGVLFSIGSALGGDFVGDMFLMLFQVFLCASAMASMTAWVYRRSRSKAMYCLCLFLLGVTPTWAAAVQYALKDTVNIGFFIYYMLAYADIILDGEHVKKSTWVKLLVFSILAALSKSFVDSIIILSLVVLLAVRWKNVFQRKRLIIAAAGLVAAVMAVSFITAHLPIFREPMEREKYSLLLQQVARYCKEYGEEMTPEQIAVVNEIMDFDVIREVYDPNISDPVKRTFHADKEDMEAFWNLYFELGKKHPDVYLRHILVGTYKYFYPFDPGKSATRMYIRQWEENGEPIYDLEYVSPDAVQAVQQYLGQWSGNFVLQMFIGPGFYVDILIVLFGYAVDRKHRQAVLFYFPLMVLIAGLLLTHVNGENRYAYPIMGTLSISVVMALWNSSQKQTDEEIEAYKSGKPIVSN